MADLVRTEHHLPTLRISLVFRKRVAHVRLRALKGDKLLCERFVPTGAIGMDDRFSASTYRGQAFALPRECVGLLLETLRSEQLPNEPLWLQIDSSDGVLGVVPWETLLRPIDCPVLRVPNFVVEPVFVEGRLRLVVCASAPRAKQYYDVNEAAEILVDAVLASVPQSEIHLFTDISAYRSLRGRWPKRVTVHDPSGAKSFGIGDTEIADSACSPWLEWIRAELGGRTVDAVHFICPGFSQRDRGALALARSPLENNDASWSHFVSAPVLRRFLDDVGARGVLLGSPAVDMWTLGVRLLANSMAWLRPGPVLLHETMQHLGDVGQAYGFLFGAEYRPPPSGGNLALSCHPLFLQMYRDPRVTIKRSGKRSDRTDPEWLQTAIESVAPPQQIVQAQSAPDWKRANQVMLEQQVFDVSGRSGATARGVGEGVRFLAGLQSKYSRSS